MNIVQIINSYFGNIVFSKVDSIGIYFLYVASILGETNEGKRYIILFVPDYYDNLPLQSHIDTLPWECIQTRLLKVDYKIKSQRWDIQKKLQDFEFTLVERKNDRTEYLPTLPNIPLKLTLFHNNKKKSIYQWYNKMRLIQSLNTFMCVLEFQK